MNLVDPYLILGFKFNPFPSASCTKGYYFTPLTKQILEELHFGIIAKKGIMVLVGEVGVGKTSLLLQLLDRLEKEENLKTSWIFNTFLSPEEILKAIALDFGLNPSNNEVSFLLNELNKFFIKTKEQGGNCAIIIDEAHNLSQESLETIRMLSNLETDGEKLVQIILAGQSELQFLLNETRFRQLRSRIQIFHILNPLSKEETINYITYKLAASGARVTISKKALSLIYRFSLGNMRMIHLLMDRAVHILVAKNSFHISSKVIRLAAEDVSSVQEPIKKALDSLYKRRTIGSFFLTISILLIITALSFWLVRGRAYISTFDSNKKTAETGNKKVSYEKEMDMFLKPYHLDLLKPFLIKAVLRKDLQVFKKKLPPRIYLIESKNVPYGKFMRFSLFPWKRVCGTSPTWIILWEPPIRIDKRFPNRSSKVDLLVFQTMLKELGFYNGKPDGKFGLSTLNAVTTFQKLHKLPITQGVDKLTLFWICFEYNKLKFLKGKYKEHGTEATSR